MITLKKLYTREFPLILCEWWGKAYESFLGEKVHTFPRLVFLLKDGLVEAFRNEALVAELDGIMLRRVADDHFFIRSFCDVYLEKYRDLHVFMLREDDISEEEFVDFGKRVIDFWPAIYYSMYVPHNEAFAVEDQDLMIELRRQIDVFADEATHFIVQYLKQHYPELGDLVMLISTDDLGGPILAEELQALADEEQGLVDEELFGRDAFAQFARHHGFTLEQDFAEQSDTVRGTVACKGFVRGRVRLVLKRSDVPLLKDDEILVSSMTVPDFLPAMRKAAAIVTDEGGVTCHAAIVSRELDKPCIIGTKIATKLFKDGDLVEVDAVNGVVKKYE